MSYVYKQTEDTLWTVGYYAPNAAFIPESDHDNREEAAKRVHYLNGGTEAFDVDAVIRLLGKDNPK